MKVQLTAKEMRDVAWQGIVRHVESIVERKPTPWAGTRKDTINGWGDDIEGILSEYCLSLVLGLPWKGAGTFHGTDVGRLEEVRSTHHSGGRLIIRWGDIEHKADKRFWLVTGLNGAYVIRGWMWCRDTQQQKWLDQPDPNRRECYAVPQQHLQPVQAVQTILQQNREGIR